MTTSGTYSFDPAIGNLALTAFSRIGVRRTMLTAQHMEDLRNEANLLQIEWANVGVLLWTQDLQTMALTAGTATYSVPANTVMILDLYISPNGTAGGMNRLIFPFSRTDYASLADPQQQGFPTSFFFLRTVSPTITFWPVPDSNGTYQCWYWRYRQIQDADPSDGGQAELQYLFLDAYVAALAHRLSRSYAPALELQREKDAIRAFNIAMTQNTENVPLYINPGLMGYFRMN